MLLQTESDTVLDFFLDAYSNNTKIYEPNFQQTFNKNKRFRIMNSVHLNRDNIQKKTKIRKTKR